MSSSPCGPCSIRTCSTRSPMSRPACTSSGHRWRGPSPPPRPPRGWRASPPARPTCHLRPPTGRWCRSWSRPTAPRRCWRGPCDPSPPRPTRASNASSSTTVATHESPTGSRQCRPTLASASSPSSVVGCAAPATRVSPRASVRCTRSWMPTISGRHGTLPRPSTRSPIPMSTRPMRRCSSSAPAGSSMPGRSPTTARRCSTSASSTSTCSSIAGRCTSSRAGSTRPSSGWWTGTTWRGSPSTFPPCISGTSVASTTIARTNASRPPVRSARVGMPSGRSGAGVRPRV